MFEQQAWVTTVDNCLMTIVRRALCSRTWRPERLCIQTPKPGILWPPSSQLSSAGPAALKARLLRECRSPEQQKTQRWNTLQPKIFIIQATDHQHKHKPYCRRWRCRQVWWQWSQVWKLWGDPVTWCSASPHRDTESGSYATKTCSCHWIRPCWSS